MTGRIKNLSAGSDSGFIEAENGLRFHFDSCAVLAYDMTYLAVGQLVMEDFTVNSNTVVVLVWSSRKFNERQEAQ